MKKTLSMIAVLVIGIVMVLPFSVFAETESDVINKLSEGVVINGKTVRVKADVLNQVKSYLNTYDLTSDECKLIIDNINLAIKKAQEEGATKWSELSAKGKQDMISYLGNITSGSPNLNAELTSKGKLTVYAPDGSVFTVIGDAVVTDGTTASTSIVNTGVTSVAVIIIAIVAVAGCVVVTKNVSRANA